MSRRRSWAITALALAGIVAAFIFRYERQLAADSELQELLHRADHVTYVAIVVTEAPQLKGRKVSQARFYHAPGGLSRIEYLETSTRGACIIRSGDRVWHYQ